MTGSNGLSATNTDASFVTGTVEPPSGTLRISNVGRSSATANVSLVSLGDDATSCAVAVEYATDAAFSSKKTVNGTAATAAGSQVLALTGISLTVIGKHPDKLKLFEPFAETKLLSDYFERDQYRPLTAEECFEYVVDAAGHESGIHLALYLVRKMGTVILKSTYAGTTNITMSQIPVGEITVVGSRCGPFEPALKLLKEGKVKFPAVELYNIKDFKEAFSSNAFKAGFCLK